VAKREPNERFAAVLKESGFTHKAFARHVQAEIDAHDDPGSVDHTSVTRWLGGTIPKPTTASHMTTVLSKRLGRTTTLEDIGLTAATSYPAELGLAYDDTAGEAVAVSLQLLDGDLIDARSLALAVPNSAAWAEASLGWLVRPDVDSLPALRGDRRVGLADVEVIRQSAGLFAQMDDRFGGDHGRRAVAQLLRTDVFPLLNGTYTETVGRQLFGAAAETMHLLAWMSYDAGAHGLAQRYFIRALRLAHAGGDVLYAASTLDAMSHQATFLGRFREAANLARAARQGSRGVSTPTLIAHFLAMEARALAGAGDVKGAEVALAQATSTFERRNVTDDPAFIQYVDDGEMAAEIAHCYRDLGNGRRAADAASQALTGSPRSDFFVTMVRADGLLLAGDAEQACDIVRSALGVGEQMRSARCVQYMRDFRARLDSLAPGSVVAAELGDYAAENLLWRAAGRVA
jgi:tetratricopeptide (TPR) repeat protein